MEQTVRGVVAMPVWDGIGITLVQDNRGWRFDTWHRADFGYAALPPSPSDADRHRYFENADAAAAHFKQRYGPQQARSA